MNTSQTTKTIGILGGGQLGKMLIQEAANLNITIAVLEPDSSAPCSTITNNFTTGSITDYNSVYNFGKKTDILTIEIEHVNIDALFQLEKEGIKVYPQPNILAMVQDKGVQKEFYRTNNIPTAPFILANNKEEAIQYFNQHKKPIIQKLRKGGYDGKGVTKLTNPADFENVFDAPAVLEDLIDFDKEIAVIVARNANGDTAVYDVVEMEFNPIKNLVEFLYLPAKISMEIAAKAKQIATNIAESCKIIGILAVEMFTTKDGNVLVNEIAPRPHNSGHHTIEACTTSQYAMHLRAILNLPLGSTDIIKPAVMVNLLGEPNYGGYATYTGLDEVMKIKGVYVHIYGKAQTKPFRKMGHVTIIDDNLEKATQTAIFIKKTLKVIST